MEMKLTRKTYAINDKHLLAQITEFVEEGFNSVEIKWTSDVHRASFTEVVEEWMLNELDDDITHFKVLCDIRNNTASAFTMGDFYFEVQYRQRNCFNISRIVYHISTKK